MSETKNSTSKKAESQVSGKPDVVAAAKEVTPEEIAALAYELWVQRGCPHGSHEEDWHLAEAQLRRAEPIQKAAGA
jgi:hypothetical protein